MQVQDPKLQALPMGMLAHVLDSLRQTTNADLR